MAIRVAINGFGRIGRSAYRAIKDRGLSGDLEVVAINDLTDTKTLAHLLRYDSVQPNYEGTISYDATSMDIDGKRVEVSAMKDPALLPWKDLEIDVVLECTGRFVQNGAARAHIDAGAKRVILSAPAKGDGGVGTYVFGVNDGEYRDEQVISNASCTTNCVSPVTTVILSAFGIEKAALTTIHAVTSAQNLVDGPHKDLRRARSAYVNIVPTTTGAAIAATETIPQLRGKFDGLAVRVPVIDVSLTDFTFVTSKKTTVEEVNEAFRVAATNPIYRGVLSVSEEPLVSSDFIMNPYSAVVDLPLTKVIDGDLVKVMAWYDNEWAYSCRLVEMAAAVGKSISVSM
jgi:glyceraldehyde 3-phosphate dehydrogenase